MTIWSLHLLNARHQLTRVLPELRATAREAVALVSEHADLPDFDLVLRCGSDVIPEWGMGGQAPAPGIIEVTLNPDRFDPVPFTRTLVHEMHHLIRWDGPGYGKSLGDALVSEGLAGHFVQQVLGGKPDPWDAISPSAGLSRRAMSDWSRLQYDHAEWFFGKGKIRKWSGYGLGYRLIAEHLSQSEGANAVSLAHARTDSFREAMRRLSKADGEPEEPAVPQQTPDAVPPPSA